MGNRTVAKISASEAERTQKEIHALLNQYPELGMNQEYVAALAALPSGIIVRARKSAPLTRKGRFEQGAELEGSDVGRIPGLGPAAGAVRHGPGGPEGISERLSVSFSTSASSRIVSTRSPMLRSKARFLFAFSPIGSWITFRPGASMD